MPEISRFYGLVIAMYFTDHQPPHFHATYGELEAVVAIADGSLLHGSLPPRALRLIRSWAVAHRNELTQEWELARNRQPLFKIDPLE